jgi:hypothetical protein
MGWKTSTIIIHKPAQVDNEKLLQELGLTSLTRIKNEPFEAVINPDDRKIYIGRYKDNLLICTSDIPVELIEKQDSAVEKSLIRLFPGSEICAIVLHSVVNLWGYAVIRNGRKIRARAGSSDDGTFVEMGEPLDEEKELLSKSTLDENGNRTYVFENDDEPLTEDQVGENFVFAVSARYLGTELDHADNALFETMMTGYSYQNEPSKKKKTKKDIPWSYIGVLILIIAWQVLKRTVFK